MCILYIAQQQFPDIFFSRVILLEMNSEVSFPNRESRGKCAGDQNHTHCGPESLSCSMVAVSAEDSVKYDSMILV